MVCINRSAPGAEHGTAHFSCVGGRSGEVATPSPDAVLFLAVLFLEALSSTALSSLTLGDRLGIVPAEESHLLFSFISLFI